MPFVISADGSSLFLKCTPQDEGITQPSPKNFICKLSKEGWRKAKHLTEPFCKPGLLNGFQWLYDIDTDIELLFSIDGSW